jgi:hypothetical protein
MNNPGALCRFSAIAMLASTPMLAAVTEGGPTTTAARTAVVNRTDMINWLADGELGLWIQTVSLKWFYARFTAVCHGVNSTNSIIFDTDDSGHIDRTSSVIVPGTGRCRLHHLVPSGGPPKSRYDDVIPRPQDQG